MAGAGIKVFGLRVVWSGSLKSGDEEEEEDDEEEEEEEEEEGEEEEEREGQFEVSNRGGNFPPLPWENTSNILLVRTF